MAIVDKLIDILDNLVVRPIGLYQKDYKFMVEHIDRNIGNHSLNSSDGFSTPVGQLSNPYYNSQYGKPSFFADSDKMRYANYLDYIQEVYGDAASITNINQALPLPSDFSVTKVGSIDGTQIKDVIDASDKDFSYINPNNIQNDTTVGVDGAKLLRQSLKLAIKENDKHDAKNFSISKNMAEYFGMNTKAYSNDILTKFINPSETTGRYEDIEINSSSPVYGGSSAWGNYKSLGAYQGYYESEPSATTQSYFLSNIGKNKYHVSVNSSSSGHTYIEKMGISVGKAADYKGSQIRYIFNTLHTSDTTYNNEGHTSGNLIGGLKSYGEKEGSRSHSYSFQTFNAGVNMGKYSTFDTDPIGVNDLLDKTNRGFMQGRYDTLIARFHTSTDYPNDDITSTAVSKAYGMSHGRNLLRGDAKNGKTFTSKGVGDGYDNPYCRVWTYHHQYHRLRDTIRPFLNSNGSVITPKQMQDKYNFGSFRTADTVGMGSGGERLTKYGVIGYNTNGGRVNIAPKKGVDIKSCMFSIENLAWKGMFTPGSTSYDTNGLSKEQKGPFGGRIMWFPPYDLKFSEQVSTNWNETSFIGRGENIYTYTNTQRDGSLSFKLLIDHPAILDYWKRRNQTDTSVSVDDVDSPEQQLLRFFAGCEMLTAKNVPQPAPPAAKETPVSPSLPSTEFKFFVFYPNDYSGKDDNSTNNAVVYLLNGTNAGMEGMNTSTRLTSSFVNKGIGYEVHDNGISTNGIPVMHGSYKGKGITWHYRVDNARKNEKLVLHKDYKDEKSFRLNSGGQQGSIRSTFSVKSNIPLYSFTDVYIALSNDTQAKVRLSGCYNESNVQLLQKIIKTYGIKKIAVKGWASSHGITHNQARNNDLNRNRRDTVLKWLKRCPVLKNKSITYQAIQGGVGPGPLASSVNELRPKLYRCAEVTVYVNTAQIKTVDGKAKETSSEGDSIAEVINYGKKGKNWVKQIVHSTATTVTANNENDTDDHTQRRYDNEAEFFKGLKVNDPFMMHKITEKIKYFDPAFHSVSPEGFNARLNFLHQCTRQGPTIGNSDLADTAGTTANNLSFGRPPVCILRLGDFYYTKIVITSLTINYDPLQWDLNHEGIGVMPMIASVDMNFHFLGGSSLAGPIARLQNALSFNFYANSEVSDDRAEQVNYDNKGEITKFKTFPE